MSSSSATADILREVDPRIWRACAGASVQIPSLHSRVYYFPQGHVEHCCASLDISCFPFSTTPVHCIVSSIELLADPVTDEVFAYLVLQSLASQQCMPLNLSKFRRYVSDEEKNKVSTFAKILTPSDANNSGGFSVPRFCADSVFPPLDFQADPPVQKLFLTDIHGVVWDFRHIYRGTPRRHLLTTGWSKFVNNKKLYAGDSVVFMRKSAAEMFVGVRRTHISSSGGDEFSSYYKSCGGADKEDETVNKAFMRTGKGKLTAEAVSEAINKAAQGLPFEVVYYPTAGWSDFVVRAEAVEASMSIHWIPGTRVKMAMETEDSSRIAWFQGTVSSSFQESGPWHGSPWKKLQITWDEPEVLQNMKRVNPWQVEVIADPNQLHPSIHPTKRLKFPQTAEFSSVEEGEIIYSGRKLPPWDSNPHLLPYTTFTPVSMQGARQSEVKSFNFFNPLSGLRKVSTEMNFNSPPSDELSPNSNTTYISSGNGNQAPTKANSFQLFGKIINVQELSESGLAESGLYEEDESKESSDNEVLNETQLSLTHVPQSL